MINIICLSCGKQFTTTSKKRKYCSTTCYSNSRLGKPWGGALNKGKGTRGNYSDYQVNQMVKGKKNAYLKRVLEKYQEGFYPMDKILEVLDNCYVDNINALVKMVFGERDRQIGKELKYLFEYLDITNKICKVHLPECYRTMTPKQSIWFKQILKQCSNFYDFNNLFLENYKSLGIRKACMKYDFLIEFVQKLNFETNALNKNLSKNLRGCGSSCESKVRDILKKLGVNYFEQARIPHLPYKCKDESVFRTSCLKPDFIVDDKFIIEVNGDYWHGYGLEPYQMNDTQLKRHKEDIEKYQFYKNNNYEFIVIWEHNLVNIDRVIQIIQKEVNNEINFKRIIYK